MLHGSMYMVAYLFHDVSRVIIGTLHNARVHEGKDRHNIVNYHIRHDAGQNRDQEQSLLLYLRIRRVPDAINQYVSSHIGFVELRSLRYVSFVKHPPFAGCNILLKILVY